MKNMKVCIVFLLLLCQKLSAQTEQVAPSLAHQFPLDISILTESAAIPFAHFIALPLHPGIAIGTEYCFSQAEHSEWLLKPSLTYYFHQNVNWALVFLASGAYRYRFPLGIGAEIALGVGYSHSFYTRPIYTLAGGAVRAVEDRGKGTVTLSPELRVLYSLDSESHSPVRFYLSYKATVEYPFAVPNGIPAFPRVFVGAGIIFSPFTAK